MQKITLLVALLFAFTFVACNKQEPIDTSNSLNVANPGGSNPTNNPNQGSPWNWTGIAPFSVIIDGTPFDTDAASVSVLEAAGYINITVSDLNGDIDLGLSVLSNSEVNKVYNMPSPCNITYTDNTNGLTMMAKAGDLKILNITATEIEGKFEVQLYDQVGGTSATKKMTEGYFKVAR